MPDLDDLVAKIRAEFPTLIFEKAVLNSAGNDHDVVVLDDALVFRFPRRAEQLERFQRELEVLTVVQPRSPIPVPDYIFIAADRSFGGYPRIRGEGLNPSRFHELAPVARSDALSALANFLRVVHALPVALVESETGGPALAWSFTDYGLQHLARRTALGGRVTPSLLSKIDAFFEAYGARPAAEHTVIHGDLRDDHILHDLASGRITGVIDFGDVELGDPAKDFAVFWAWGETAVHEVYMAYDPQGLDGALSERARWEFARWQIDNLHRQLSSDETRWNESVTYAETALTTLGLTADSPLQTVATVDDPQRLAPFRKRAE